MTRLCVRVGGRSCHCSHLGAGKFTLSVQGQLQPLTTDQTALTQIHSPPVLESETCDQGVGRAELPPEEGPSGLAQPLGDPRPPWACGHITPTSASICTNLPWVALCLRSPPLLFQGHPSLDLGSTCIPGDLVQRSGTYFLLLRPFIRIRSPL